MLSEEKLATLTKKSEILIEALPYIQEFAGKTLIDALNLWVTTYGSEYGVTTTWEATGPDGYPLPVGSYTSSLRK